MYTWKSNKGEPLFFFVSKNYEYNVSKSRSWTSVCFSQYITVENIFNYEGWFFIEADYNVENYFSNFITKLPDKPIFYFDESSKFPRTKLNFVGYKRCIKPEKANVIVIQNVAQVKTTSEEYIIFTDSEQLFGISASDFIKYFNGDFNNMKANQSSIGYDFKDKLLCLYSGRLKGILDPTETIKKFNNNTYKKPFILDNELDRIVNENLPDPDLDSLLTIKDMINSTDRSVVKLGANMAAGFNLTKWPLTFRVLLGTSGNWAQTYYGGNSVVIKQMWNTLKFKRVGLGFYCVCSLIDSLKETYSKEDIRLAQELATRIPGLEDWCKKNQRFYLDDIPFIPDEYKN